jgi:hypothetical protein
MRIVHSGSSRGANESFSSAPTARTNGLDAELRWMLPYYCLVEPSYLDRFEELDALKRISGRDPLAYRRECLKGSFENRGHMGRHWKAKQAILRRRP